MHEKTVGGSRVVSSGVWAMSLIDSACLVIPRGFVSTSAACSVAGMCSSSMRLITFINFISLSHSSTLYFTIFIFLFQIYLLYMVKKDVYLDFQLLNKRRRNARNALA